MGRERFAGLKETAPFVLTKQMGVAPCPTCQTQPSGQFRPQGVRIWCPSCDRETIVDFKVPHEVDKQRKSRVAQYLKWRLKEAADAWNQP